MELIILGGLCACTLAMFAWREYQHDTERRDLYTRIQARDLTEYTHSTSTRPPPRSRNLIAAGLRRYYQQAGDE